MKWSYSIPSLAELQGLNDICMWKTLGPVCSCLPGCCLDVLFPWFLPSSSDSTGIEIYRRAWSPPGGVSFRVAWLNSSPPKAEFIYKQSEYIDSTSPIFYTNFSVHQGYILWPEVLFPFPFLLLLLWNVTYVQKSAKTCLYPMNTLMKKHNTANPACFWSVRLMQK